MDNRSENPGERRILAEMHSDEKKVAIVLTIVFTLLIILSGAILYLILRPMPLQKIIVTKQEHITPSATSSPTNSPLNASPSPAEANVNVSQNYASPVKDYFISLGSGTSDAGDWTDVPGVSADINFGNYRSIKEIRFEVSIYVPTANETVSVRLYNMTDKHPVWNSEVTSNGGQTEILTSSPLVYDTGEKVYQVQMKTQLRYSATLVQSRIHIILK